MAGAEEEVRVGIAFSAMANDSKRVSVDRNGEAARIPIVIPRGLSPLAPESVALKSGKLVLAEIDGCLRSQQSFALESTLSGHAQVDILRRAKARGYRIEIFYLWLPSPAIAIKRIAQRVKKGGHRIAPKDVERRYSRSLVNFVRIYAPLADLWQVWSNTRRRPVLTLSSERASLRQLEELLLT